MLLFGMVDVCLLSVFLITSTFVLQIAFMDILIQFILPMNVTCCICFRLLCSKEDDYVSSTLFSCLIWIAVWTLVVLKDSIYEHISTSIWCGMMILSVLYCVTVFGEYGNAVKDITRVMGQVYKNIMVSITRNYTTVVIREM